MKAKRKVFLCTQENSSPNNQNSPESGARVLLPELNLQQAAVMKIASPRSPETSHRLVTVTSLNSLGSIQHSDRRYKASIFGGNGGLLIAEHYRRQSDL
jgi:hypothetical protein